MADNDGVRGRIEQQWQTTNRGKDRGDKEETAIKKTNKRTSMSRNYCLERKNYVIYYRKVWKGREDYQQDRGVKSPLSESKKG